VEARASEEFLANGIHEVNGSILDDANYAKYILDIYAGDIELQRQALARTIAANSNGTIS
jgi:hypothetical protein